MGEAQPGELEDLVLDTFECEGEQVTVERGSEGSCAVTRTLRIWKGHRQETRSERRAGELLPKGNFLQGTIHGHFLRTEGDSYILFRNEPHGIPVWGAQGQRVEERFLPPRSMDKERATSTADVDAPSSRQPAVSRSKSNKW